MKVNQLPLGQIDQVLSKHPYPLVFITVSGAHLYGFPSPDSDWDLRGVHLLPVEEVVGLEEKRETVEHSSKEGSFEADFVTHDAAKFFGLMLKKNGYVLEQLFSPIVVRTSPAHEELREIGKLCVTKWHGYHYLGFAETQWKLFSKEERPRVKPLCYVYRVLLTGIHLMRTGVVEANLLTLNEEFRLGYVPELIERKVKGAEKGVLEGSDLEFHRGEYERLRSLLEEEMGRSKLREVAEGKRVLNNLLVRLRLGK